MLGEKKQNKTIKCDILVIGSGSAGSSAAFAALARGANVCIVEKEKIGGECPNWACVPTKVLLKSAKVYYLAKHEMQNYGVHAQGVTFNFGEMAKRKDAAVGTITGNGKRMEKILSGAGAKIIKGSAKFIDDKTVSVGLQKISFKKAIIATGGSSFIPPISGLKESGFMTFREAVSLKKAPRSIAIIGGGPVACEFATFFQMIGTKVTILQIGKQILGREDQEIVTIAHKQLADLGVNILTNTKTLSVQKAQGKRRVTFQQGSKKRQTVVVDKVLVAAGKRANIEDLKIEKIGIELDKRGYIQTNDRMQTSVGNIFAAGDVNAGFQFTHMAHYEGEIAGINCLAKSARSMKKVDDRVVPRVTFLKSEVASVGLTSAEASKLKIEIHKFPVGALGRAVTDGDRIGLLKVITEKKTGKILGGHMVGARAGEVIHEIALGMKLNAKLSDLSEMIHAFPTYSEAIAALD